MNACPTDQELEALLDERAVAVESPAHGSSLLTHHLEICPPCQVRLDALDRDRRFMDEIASALTDSSRVREQRTAVESPSAGTLEVPGYEIDREIHRGAQGVVFAARQIATNRTVALKVLFHESGTSLRMRQRFLREVELAAQLRHARVVTIHESGETRDGRLYFAMEHVAGERLDRFVAALADHNGSVDRKTQRRILSLFADVCDAVAHAHEAGVIHRDLKPGNILVEPNGAPKVLDFGLAKATSAERNERIALNTIAGSFMGTIAYASPEQASGRPDDIDARTDVYSLGVLLYEMVAGKLPYDVKGALTKGIEAVLNAPPMMPIRWRNKTDDGPVVERDIETIILKALAKDKTRRYATVAELRDDLHRYLGGEPIHARREHRTYVIGRHLRRHRRPIAIAGTIAVLAIAVAVLVNTLSNVGQTVETAQATAELYASKAARLEWLAGTSGAALEEPDTPAAGAYDPMAIVAVCAPEPPTSLNPFYMRPGDLFVCELIFERLFWRTSALELVPNEHLVESIVMTDDPTIVIVHLRRDVTWHDGAPFTADDIVFSWKTTVSPAVRSTKARQVAHVADIRAPDPHTVEFEFDEPHATWQLSMNFELAPKHLYERGIEEDETLRASKYFDKLHHAPVGTGPFRLISWNDDEIRLERFDRYEAKGYGPYFAGLVVRWPTTPEARLDAFLRGELDLVELTEDQYEQYAFSDAFRAIGREARRPSSRYHFIQWNTNDPRGILADARVRIAMTHAIDVARIKSEVTHNLSAACYGPWPIESIYFDSNFKRLADSPALADRQLTKSGWIRRPDGLRYPAAKRSTATSDAANDAMQFELLVYDTDDESRRTAEIIRQNLGAVGVEVQLAYESNRSELLGRLDRGEFDACLMAITPAVDPSLHRAEFAANGKRNFGSYANVAIDHLFEEAEQTYNPVARAKVFQRMHSLLYADQPRTFLYHDPSLWALSHRLSGVSFSQRGPFYFQPGLLSWFVPADER